MIVSFLAPPAPNLDYTKMPTYRKSVKATEKPRLSLIRSAISLGENATVAFLSLLILTVSWLPLSVSAEEPNTETKTEVAETPAYNTFTNADLLERAEGIYQGALDLFRTEKRGLAKAEFLLNKATDAKSSFNITHAIDGISIGSTTASVAELSIDQIKANADDAENDLNIHQQKVELVQKEQLLLQAYIDHLNSTESSITSLQSTIVSLQLPLLEIKLRIEDGTLSEKQIPLNLQDEQIQAQSEQLSDLLSELRQQLTRSQRSLEQLTVEANAAEAKSPEVETKYNSAKTRLSEALKQQDLLQEFADYPADTLLDTLSQMQGELIGLNGTLQISANRYNRVINRIGLIENQIESSEQPDSSFFSGKNIRTEEVEEVSTQIGDFVSFQDQNIKQLQNLRRSYKQSEKEGNVYQGDAAVLNEHVFRMQVPAKIINQKVNEGELREEAIPRNADVETLTAIKTLAEESILKAITGIKNAQVRTEEITNQIDKARQSRKDAKERLVQVIFAAEAAKKAKQWSAEIGELSAAEVVARFEQTQEELNNNVEVIENTRTALEEADLRVQHKKEEFESLTDPLLRITQGEAGADRVSILKRLYSFTDLELPADIKESTDGSKATSSQNKKVEHAVSDTQQYLNLLTTRSHVISQQTVKRQELIDELKALKQKSIDYTNAIGTTNTLTQKQYANAIELKTRIGRRELGEEEIPQGITAALNQEDVIKLETELSRLINHSARTDQELETLSQPHENLEKLRELLEQTIASMGKRLDVIKDLEKLKEDISESASKRTKIEKASLEQDAARRLENESSRKEWLLGYVPSARAEHMTNVLKVYYQELIELEEKLENVGEQQALTQRVLELVEEEKNTIDELTPYLKEEKQVLRSAEEEAWIVTQAGFMPDKALELIDQYEAKSDVRLTAPPPVNTDERVTTIEHKVETLFVHHTEVLAADKWISLFENRLAANGLQGEIANYQEQLGAIQAQAAAIQRRINRVAGYPAEAFDELDPADRPVTKSDKTLFFGGEIGRLRIERADIWSQSIVQLLARLAVIWVLAFILSMVFSRLMSSFSNRHKESESTNNAQTLLVLSFIKTMGKIVIWMTAIILIFSSLGFNVGAVLAGLGIGGLAIAMAAKETLSDLLGGIMIFIERPFVIGDVIKIGNGTTTTVVDMTWRSTLLRTGWNYYYSTPNSQVANSIISNFSKEEGPVMDFMLVHVSPEHDPDTVMALISKAVLSVEGKYGDEGGATLGGIKMIGNMTVMGYWPWWYVDNYAARGKYRGWMWKAIWRELTDAGIKLELKPIDQERTKVDPKHQLGYNPTKNSSAAEIDG